MLILFVAAHCQKNFIEENIQNWNDGRAAGIMIYDCQEHDPEGGCKKCAEGSTFNGIDCVGCGRWRHGRFRNVEDNIWHCNYPWKRIMQTPIPDSLGGLRPCMTKYIKFFLSKTRNSAQWENEMQRQLSRCQRDLIG